MTEQNKKTPAIWLVNTTLHPIHIGQPGKDAEGNNLDNIRLSTMGAVCVDESATKIRGVAYLIKKGSLKIVTEAQAKRLIKQHDKAISQPETEDEEE